MDNFITINYMGSFVGMVAIIVLLTQFTKDLIDKVVNWLPTKYVVFIYSLIIIFGYQVMSCTFNKSQILLTLINAILLTMTAQGGYEWIYKPIEQKTTPGNIMQVGKTVNLKSGETVETNVNDSIEYKNTAETK